MVPRLSSCIFMCSRSNIVVLKFASSEESVGNWYVSNCCGRSAQRAAKTMPAWRPAFAFVFS
jgi:hypothetical protein